MKYIFISFAIVISLGGYSQNKKFSIELNYPIIIKSNYDNHSGIIDGAIKYRLIDLNKIKTGISISYDYSIGHVETQFAPKYKRKRTYYNINLFEELHFSKLKNLRPFMSFGYTLLFYKYEHNVGQYYDSDYSNKRYNGLNIKAGVSYSVYKNIYVQTNYQYVYTLSGTGYPYYKTVLNGVNQIKFGVGYRF